MIIELHALQSFGPSNLNRDDTGNPKEALFGGVQRARISSQSAKRAIRVSNIFKEGVRVPIADRTRHLIPDLIKRLEQEGVDKDWATQHVPDVIGRTSLSKSQKALYAQLSKKSSGEESETEATGVAIYISKSEVQEIVNKLVETNRSGEVPDSKEWAKWCRDFSKKIKDRTSAPDIALFGRMLADNPDLKIDAACQVAHAISTHAVNTEFDFFTAVDDLQQDDETGAAMMGYVHFNSATYYRCARIDWEQLVDNLGGDEDLTRQTISAFMRAFALVVPTGMTNSFLNKHQPDFLLAAARPNNDGQSLANAFEKPVEARNDSGYAEPSIKALCQYWDRIEGCFRLGKPTIAILNPRGYDLYPDEYAPVLDDLEVAQVGNLGEWVGKMTAALSEG